MSGYCRPGPYLNPPPGSFSQTQLQAMLLDAQTQYHALVTGQQASVLVDQNGERIQYTQANRNDLYQYIQGLIGQLNALANPRLARDNACPGPMRFLF